MYTQGLRKDSLVTHFGTSQREELCCQWNQCTNYVYIRFAQYSLVHYFGTSKKEELCCRWHQCTNNMLIICVAAKHTFAAWVMVGLNPSNLALSPIH